MRNLGKSVTYYTEVFNIMHCSEPMYALMKPVDIKGVKLLFKILE